MKFRDRFDAGRCLAAALAEYAGRSDVVVLALPRGGVPVGFEVASALRVPLDVFVVRKLGVPGHQELAMGAISSGGVEVLSDDLIRSLGISASAVRDAAARERVELGRREVAYRSTRAPLSVRGRTVIVVDDGLATGSTMHAAVLALKQQVPASVIVAVPLGARETCERLRHVADRVVCVETPEPFEAVGLWYQDFSQTSDEEVAELLNAAGGVRQSGNTEPGASEPR